MNVSDVLGIAEQFNANIITGKKGLKRSVSSIEVMEVPEVQDWVREGLLIITTFYSVRNNPEEQIRIIKVLIQIKAAGIIIKIGRFIKKLPDEVIKLAKDNDFPIIILPKDVPYINILNPLYSELREREETIRKSILDNFDKKSFHTVEEALEDLAEITDCSIYIEDMGGRLLFHTKRSFRDGWRNSILLFETPSHNSYQEKINQWQQILQKKLFLEEQLPGQKDRIIIPLVAKEGIFALIHFVFNLRMVL